MNEQGGSDEQVAAQGPYPSTATAGAAKPDAPPPDIGQQDLSSRGADDVVATSTDFVFLPATRPGLQEEVTQRNARTNT